MAAPKYNNDQSSAVMHDEFMAFVCDGESQRVIRECASGFGFPEATVQSGGVGLLQNLLEFAPAPKLVIVDIDDQNDPSSLAPQLIALCGAECKIIAIGTSNDIGLYRQMVGAGIADYLVKPLMLKDLNQAITNALRGPVAHKTEAKDAKLIIVIGARGGVGASTVAVNTGWLLAHKSKLNCALLDLDLQFGTSSLALDLEPGRGLRTIINSPDRVDSLMIASSIVTESAHFSVLGGEEAIDEQIHVDSGAVMALVKEMQGNYDCIVIDMPRHLLAAQKRLLSSAHEVVLVTELSLAGIRDTLRIKNALSSLGCKARLTFVAARAGPTRAGQVRPEVFEKSAQIKIDLTIPEDHKNVTQAANTGKSLGTTAPTAPITKAFEDLAQRLAETMVGASQKAAQKKPTTSMLDQMVRAIKGTDKRKKE